MIPTSCDCKDQNTSFNQDSGRIMLWYLFIYFAHRFQLEFAQGNHEKRIRFSRYTPGKTFFGKKKYMLT